MYLLLCDKPDAQHRRDCHANGAGRRESLKDEHQGVLKEDENILEQG